MKKIWTTYIEASLIIKISIALVLGVAAGFLFGEDAAVISPLGDLLIRLLKFLIIPLILFTIIVGINQSKITNLARMGGKVFLYYLTTSAIAIVIALGVASLFNPGKGLSLDPSESVEVPENPAISEVLLNIVPENIVSAFGDFNLLGIIFTALVFGVAIAVLRGQEKTREAGDLLYRVADGLNEATFKVMGWVLQYLPIGIFAIIAKTVGSQGLDTLTSLGSMVLVFYLAIFAQLLIYVLILKVFGIKLGNFLKHARTPILTAFVTQSSSGTLPLTLNAAERLKLNQGLYGFSLPLGATINMDGAAIRVGVSVVFAANVMSTSFSFTNMIEIVIVGTLATIGTAGVPGAGIIMIATVFSQAGLPIEVVALLTSIDALVGMGATGTNVAGDLVGTTVISKTEDKRETHVQRPAPNY
ncbi:C4-dicarboxylate transport protein [Lentibacillus sp. JNUCC-1]|uniref:dicarboxylate/amino acid:cation symporter n=1 Tax=Lentibacillus sp. JNUCC-1 TaxID=2654513 RepID=UPI0012E7C1E9|nr:dicarboxylate/amino acid:cation symporter [Lentibacillus sp. JNUCC-1]MUV36802.1 C4-dicarboxylate transport protein [Lentibacillus sp. JNUCC-1]